MDVIGVRGMKSPKEVKRNRREKKAAVKVVYISSPMKVKASASEFRALVQELTGRHSDAERAFLEMDYTSTVGSSHPTVLDGDDRKRIAVVEGEIDGRDDGGFESSAFGLFDFSMDQFGNNGASLFSISSRF